MDARLLWFIDRCRAIMFGSRAILVGNRAMTPVFLPNKTSQSAWSHTQQQDETFVSETMAPFLLRDRFQAAALSRKRFKSKAKHGSNRMKDMKQSFKRLKSEMEEISEEQKNIREGQSQVKEKFESIESECEELKRETKLIIQQSARTQIKLTLMFRILKAREASEFNIAAQLTEVLRAIVKREEEGKAKLTVE